MNIEDMDPKMLDDFLKKGLITQEQIDNLRREEKEKEERERQMRIKKQRAQERNYGNQRKQRSQGYHPAESHQQRPYGEEVDLPAAELPPKIATAPYNFVPLPNKALVSSLQDYLDKGSEWATEGEDPISAAFRAYMEKEANLKGYIDLKIETVTPVYISGGENGKSFSPTGEYIIPGSSLRGMVKNLYKIVTCGSWREDEDIKDTHLYYRCLMAPKGKKPMPFLSKLHEKYSDYMASMENGHVKRNAKPGFLVKQGDKWLIYPLFPEKLHSIPIYEYMENFHLNDEGIKYSSVRWKGSTAYIQIGMRNTDKLRRSKKELESATEEERESWGKQYYRYMSMDDIDKSKCYTVPDTVIESYQEDKNRRGVDLMNRVQKKYCKFLKRDASIAPCFFFLDDAGQVKSFGHGQSYRIPYDNSIMDAVPQEMQSSEKIDFANAVFGMSRRDVSFASRVSFDDAVPSSAGTLPPDEAHILMQPNPTAFQLYLKQTEQDQLVHWDHPAAEIRGYKLYWHSKPEHNWHATSMERSLNRDNVSKGKPSLTKKIEPLKPGSEFAGRIRFRDLTREELGALMLIFRLDKGSEDIVYKIGMGKGIGLGSIRIKAALFLEDGSRYQKLFDEDGWNESQKEVSPDEYIDAYETFVQGVDQGKLAQSYREAVENLRLMLDYSHTEMSGWKKATMQMDGNTQNRNRIDRRFEKRNILPTAMEVVDKVKNRNP